MTREIPQRLASPAPSLAGAIPEGRPLPQRTRPEGIMERNVTAGELQEAGVEVLVVLDFDGVVNRDAHTLDLDSQYYPGDRQGTGDTWRLGPGLARQETPRTWPLVWSSELIEDLNVLLSDTRVRLLWLTTWTEDILPVERTLGLAPQVPSLVLNYSKKFSDHVGSVSKQRVLRSFLEDAHGGNPPAVAWVDDVATEDLQHNEILQNEVFGPVPPPRRLVITPREDFGLSRPQVKTLRTFVEAHLSEAPRG